MKIQMAAAILAMTATAFAAGPNGGKGPMMRGGMEGGGDPVVRMVTNPKIAEKIGLTDEQRKQIKQIDKAYRVDDQRKALRAAMEKQSELLKAEKVDEAAVMAEIDKAFEARKEIAKRQTKRVISIKAILTPEQIQKALEAFRNRPKRGNGPRAGEAKADPEPPKPACEAIENKD